MGFEYRLEVPSPGTSLERLLRSIPGFAGVEPTYGGYLYRREGTTGDMPNAEARIEDGGLYLCDYGAGTRFVSAIVMACLSEYDRVTVSKL